MLKAAWAIFWVCVGVVIGVFFPPLVGLAIVAGGFILSLFPPLAMTRMPAIFAFLGAVGAYVVCIMVGLSAG